ncbi:MAG: SulP family inorganic anion transporter [Gammaproteobacteria bacterium]|nr:SulP family inorganic anion transporter [Gammaproteobacteria bacterium]
MNDIWGGLASMLVVLPASIAFGVAIYSPLGEGSTALGAMAGIIGAVGLGLVAPIFGGTRALVTAPCAPAAAVMAALSIELVGAGQSPGRVMVLMTLAALISGALQVFYGSIRGGTLIKYIPYPVVTGYLSGVGVVIFLKQLPPFFGWAKDTPALHALGEPGLWQWPGVTVGVVTIAVMMLAPRITKVVPSAILGLVAGIAAYFALGLFKPELLHIEGNPLLIGELGGQGGSFLDAFSGRWTGLVELSFHDLGLILMPALTLSVLLSIDTLKTCVLVDALTHTRHNSNREMIAQGVANICSATVGGMPGAGTSGPTLVNIASGGNSRLSGLLSGGFVLLAFLLLGGLVAWAPIAALAGILIVVAYRMFDWSIFSLLKKRSTMLDFMVIVIVIGVAVSVGLIQASGVGIALAIILFIRELIRGTVIHRRLTGCQMLSRQRRLPEQMEILARRGEEILICELEGNLFFGTTDQLYSELEEDLKTRRFIILDMRRVRGVDYTAVHVLEQIEARLEQRGAKLLFSNLPRELPTGTNLHIYFDEVGLVTPESHGKIFPQLSDALEWVENHILEEAGQPLRTSAPPIKLRDFAFTQGRSEETLQALEACAVERSLAPGETLFHQGETGDAIYLIRKGGVKIVLKLQEGGEFHIATFRRGDFFGDMAFLDRETRSADAVAETATELYEISRERFDAVAARHPRLGMEFFNSLARSLAIRLRYADGEIRALEDS